MIRLRAKVTNNTATAALDSLLKAFEDQQAMARDAMEAVEPIAAAARVNIRKKTGRTHDQITVWADEHAPAGAFAVFVGIPGPDILGSASRAYIGRILEEGRKLEFGSSQRKAFPWLRTAMDAEGGGRLTQRFADIARARLGR
jgi:hypothetical protein